MATILYYIHDPMCSWCYGFNPTWNRIQDMLGTKFNFEFWDKNIPRRSTYPACRAVLAARTQNFEKEMIWAIQKGYYRRALNPSDDNILIQLVTELKNELVELEIDVDQFSSALNSKVITQELTNQISLSRQLTQRGFPSLVLEHNGTIHFLEHDYQDQNVILSRINSLLNLAIADIEKQAENS
jgi:putative protein-disulfide isomerase